MLLYCGLGSRGDTENEGRSMAGDNAPGNPGGADPAFESVLGRKSAGAGGRVGSAEVLICGGEDGPKRGPPTRGTVSALSGAVRANGLGLD